MLFEIVLYVERRMSGRVLVGDGEITTIVENGAKRDPKSKSFNEIVKYIQDKTDLIPVGQPQQIGPKLYFTTYKHTYRKVGVYIQTGHDRWAMAYPANKHWMVKKAGVDLETRYETAQQARRAVDDWCGTVADLKELREEGMVSGREESLSAEQVLAKRARPQIEDMTILQCYAQLDKLAERQRTEGRGYNPDAYQAKYYCKFMRKKVKSRLKELGAPPTRPGRKKAHGPGQAPWQKG